MISEIRDIKVFDQKKTIFIRENSLDNDLFENTLEMINAFLCCDTEHEIRVQIFFLHALNDEIFYLEVEYLNSDSFDIIKKIVDMHIDDHYVMKILS